MQPVLWAAAGTGFTCLMTVLGASMVFFLRKRVTEGAQRIFLGFAAGVMVAASVWSLLIPAMEEAEASGLPAGCRRWGASCWASASCCCWMCCCPTSMWIARQPEGLHSSWRRTTCWCWP